MQSSKLALRTLFRISINVQASQYGEMTDQDTGRLRVQKAQIWAVRFVWARKPGLDLGLCPTAQVWRQVE